MKELFAVIGFVSVVGFIALWISYTSPRLKQFGRQRTEFLYARLLAPAVDLIYLTFVLLNNDKKISFALVVQWFLLFCIIAVAGCFVFGL